MGKLSAQARSGFLVYSTGPLVDDDPILTLGRFPRYVLVQHVLEDSLGIPLQRIPPAATAAQIHEGQISG